MYDCVYVPINKIKYKGPLSYPSHSTQNILCSDPHKVAN
jgi:hypothetical protein